jgi:hypothetical protein
MNSQTRTASLILTGATLLMSSGCGAAAPCRKGPKDDVVMAARTGGKAVETGVETGVEGVKAGGRAVGGFVTDGSSGAAEEWKKGKADTKAEANEGAAETSDEAKTPRCD